MRRNMLLLLLLLLGASTLIVSFSYAMYRGTDQVIATATTGEVICQATIDTNENYVENNEAYFMININNFKTENGTTITSDAIIDYTLTIENKAGSNGLYRYVDDDGNSSDTPVPTLVIQRRIEKGPNTQQVRVFVSSDTNLRANVDFVVKLEAVQANLE